MPKTSIGKRSPSAHPVGTSSTPSKSSARWYLLLTISTSERLNLQRDRHALQIGDIDCGF